MRRLVVLTAVSVLLAVVAAPVGANYPTERDIIPASRATVLQPVQRLGHDLGKLEIPAIGLDETIREGVHQGIIDKGVAHWAGTSNAGGHGNMVLAGHRTTWSRPFYDLDRLDPGELSTKLRQLSTGGQ